MPFILMSLCISSSVRHVFSFGLETVKSCLINFMLYCSQIIMLSASANKLARLKEQAEEYAALIMEELDPEGLGYIEVSLLLKYATPVKCHYIVQNEFVRQPLLPCQR